MARKQRPFWTIDCETDPFQVGRIPEPFLWGIYDGHNYEYQQFETVSDVVSYLRDKDVTVYAHNGGKFDYHYLRSYIDGDSPISVIAGRLAKFTIGACEFRDSLNLFGQTRLKDFAKMDIDYKLLEKGERHKPENWKLICEYLKSDCVNLYNLVAGFISQYGMQFTQAGASMKYWTKQFNKPAPRSTQKFYDDFHPFYFGGRVQCFQHGYKEEQFKLIDINSAYPRAMCDEHPYSTQTFSVKKLPYDERMGPMMVELTANSRGCLPLYGPHHDGLYFPDDKDKLKRRYFVTGWEVMAGLETKTLDIDEIHTVYKFNETVSFKDYVNRFYSMRKAAKAAGDKAQDIFAKIFLNSLYGKFAANPRKYQEYVLPSAEKYAEWLERGWIDDGTWQDRQVMTRALPEERHRYYNIATAASITGWVRAYLWRAICQVYGMIYCDTDSIACLDTGSLPLGNELGEWKLEFIGDRWAITGKKTYAFHKLMEFWKEKDREPEEPWKVEWKVASKGMRLTPDEIIALSQGTQFTHLTKVPNYSIHSKKLNFLNRLARSTYKDVSVYPIGA